MLIDTNYILRYILRDHEEQYNKIEPIFNEIEINSIKATILESVLAECVYVLSTFYKVSKAEICKTLTELLNYKGINNKDKDDLIFALELFEKNGIAFVDCILVSKAKSGGKKIGTFDAKLLKLAKKR